MFHRGQDVRVHWWYRPDSYDEFVSASVAPLDLDDDKPNTKGARACVNVLEQSLHARWFWWRCRCKFKQSSASAGPWKLYARWLVDSDRYNEWMNEVDYETEDAAADQDAVAGERICSHITTSIELIPDTL